MIIPATEMDIDPRVELILEIADLVGHAINGKQPYTLHELADDIVSMAECSSLFNVDSMPALGGT